jgi:hypothetical protein
MRPIEFRGKCKDDGKWVTGHLYEKAAPLQCIGEQGKGNFGELLNLPQNTSKSSPKFRKHFKHFFRTSYEV